MNLSPLCEGYMFYLLFLATFFTNRFCETKDREKKRNTKKDYRFISSHYQDTKFDPSQFSSVHKYKVRLYSKASESNIRVIGRRKIDSLGRMNSADSVLVIETVAFGVIRIRGQLSGLYLCINKKGHLVAKRNIRSTRCAFIVEDDHPQAYKRYVSLANPSYRIAFNKNGRPRTATRVPSRWHRSVLFVERRLSNGSSSVPLRTRRHRQDSPSSKDPCKTSNKNLLSTDWLKFWKEYCDRRKQARSKYGQISSTSS